MVGGWLGNTAPDLLDARALPVPGWAWRVPAVLPIGLALADRGRQLITIWSLVALLSMVLGYQQTRSRTCIPYTVAESSCTPSIPCREKVGAEVRITAWPQQSGDSWRAPAIITRLGTVSDVVTGIRPRIGDSVLIRGKSETPHLWEVLPGVLELGPPRPATIQGGFDQARYLQGRGIGWTGRFTPAATSHSLADTSDAVARMTDLPIRVSERLLAPLRDNVITRLENLLPPLAASMMASVLLGEKDELSRIVRQPFAVLGLAHLFAVSGLHVGILLAIILLALNVLSPSPVLRLLIVMPTLLVYLILTGMSPSVCRAVGLANLVLLAPLAGRRYDSLHGLGLLFWLNYLWSPWSLVDTGLRLSYLAAVGIVSVCRLTRDLAAGLRFGGNKLITGLTVTLAAQWFTLPEIVASFGWVNLAGPLANLVAVPVFGAAVWFCVLALICDLIWPWLAGAISACGWILMRLLVGGAFLFAGRGEDLCWSGPPFGPWRLAGFISISILLLRRLVNGFQSCRRPPWRDGAVVAVLGLGLMFLIPVGRTTGRGTMTAIQFDVGQGDCTLITFPDSWRILIDTGSGRPGQPAGSSGSDLGRSVLPWLRREGITKIDVVLLTHGHADHTCGAYDLAQAIDIHCWYLGGMADPGKVRCVAGAIGGQLAGGTELHRHGRWSLVCRYRPERGEPDISENNRSTVVGLYHDARLLAVWGGDLETEGEQQAIMTDRRPPTERIQLWKAGHHGSRTSGSAAYLEYLYPHLITISCGVANRHHHPSHGPYVVHGDTIRSVRSDLAGTMIFKWDDDGILHWQSRHKARGTIP